MNKTAILASFVCASAAAAGGYFLIPGEAEKLAMLLRDGQQQAALARANDLFASGARDPTLLMQAFTLNQVAGAHDRAAEILDAYLLQRPDDAAAWRRATQVFEESGRTESLRNALENVVRLTGDPAAAGKLAAIYRFGGDEDSELRVLGAVRPEGLIEADAMRLAHLLVARDRRAEAVSALLAVDGRNSGLSDEGRIHLFTLLLDQKDHAKAEELALHWQKDGEPSPLRNVFVAYLLRAGADEQAFRLATSDLAIGDSRTIAALALLFYDEGRYDMVERLMQASLAHAGQSQPGDLDAYVAEIVATGLAKGVGNYLFAELFHFVVAAGLDEVQASFIQALYDQVGYPGLAPFRHAIAPHLLSRRPVLAARLFAAERNALQARRFLMATDLREQSDKARMEWMELARQILSPRELDAELAWRARAKAIPTEMLAIVMEALGRGGSQPHAMAVWGSLVDAGTPQFADRVSAGLRTSDGSK